MAASAGAVIGGLMWFVGKNKTDNESMFLDSEAKHDAVTLKQLPLSGSVLGADGKVNDSLVPYSPTNFARWRDGLLIANARGKYGLDENHGYPVHTERYKGQNLKTLDTDDPKVDTSLLLRAVRGRDRNARVEAQKRQRYIRIPNI